VDLTCGTYMSVLSLFSSRLSLISFTSGVAHLTRGGSRTAIRGVATASACPRGGATLRWLPHTRGGGANGEARPWGERRGICPQRLPLAHGGRSGGACCSRSLVGPDRRQAHPLGVERWRRTPATASARPWGWGVIVGTVDPRWRRRGERR
jgi:hypothetical protein